MRVKLKEINPNPANPRTIKDKQFGDLKRSIAQFPAMLAKRPIAVTKDGKNWMAIGGNQRTRALLDLQKDIEDYDGFLRRYECTPDAAAILVKYFADGVPVVDCTDLSPDEQRRFIIADNLPFGEWDTEALANEWDVDELKDWGMPEFIFGDPGEGDAAGGSVEDDDFEMPDENTIVTDIKLGDLFEIGPHRLLCGDSTDKTTVEHLMNGVKADMVFTDPPYGVNVKGGKNKSNIAGDLTQVVIPFSFELCIDVATKPISVFYFCGAEINIGLYGKLFERFLNQLPRHLIWVKKGFVMKPNGYHNQYEIIFHGYKTGGGALSNWFGGRTEHEASDVWVVARDASSTYEHPTQKPIELPSRAIRNSCPPNGLVYEPFSGSGSTMAAAHQLGRICYAIEIDPKYCQVTINRMLKLDPSLQVKRNGEPYIENSVNNP